MTQRGAYVYTKATSPGFQKMREKGAVTPQFDLEDAVSQTVAEQYDDIFDGVEKEIREAADSSGYQVRRTAEGETLVADAAPRDIVERLRALIGQGGVSVEKLRKRLNSQLLSGQMEFFRRFLNTVDPKTAHILLNLSLSKDEAFRGRLDRLRALYLNDAVERIKGEEDLLKKRFLQRLVDWAEGKAEHLNVSKLMGDMRKTSVHRARFFARDQFSKFNKALTVASFQEAEAPYVEWLTVGDGRVRPEHRKRNHRVYTLDALLRDPEWSSYQCRCGFIPRYEKPKGKIYDSLQQEIERIEDELSPEVMEKAAWLVRSVMAETSTTLDKQLQFSFDFLGERLDVFTVNGDFARRPVEKGGMGCQNFTMGMNGYAAREPMYHAQGWCGEREVCLHNLLSPVAFLCTLVHECFERWAMKNLGMGYDEAHERYGNAAEHAAHMVLEAPEWRWQE